MPRRPRNILKNLKILHVVVHGIDKEYLYKNDNQKYEYIKLIKKYQCKYNINIISYCIMSNHAHMLIKFDKIEELSKFMQRINTNYAIYYNKNKNRKGYVYQDRFYSEPILNREHFINCIVYIHNNPVKAKMCQKAKEYKFSSYYECIEKADFIKDFFITKEGYEKTHRKKELEYNFIDYDIDNKKESKEYIFEYLKKIDKKIEDIAKDKVILKDICKKVRKKYKISYKDLEDILHISREKIRKILIE